MAVAKWDSIALIIEPCQKNGMSSVSTEVEYSEHTKRLRPTTPTPGSDSGRPPSEISPRSNVGVGAAG